MSTSTKIVAISRHISDREIVVQAEDRVMAIADRDRLKQVLLI